MSDPAPTWSANGPEKSLSTPILIVPPGICADATAAQPASPAAINEAPTSERAHLACMGEPPRRRPDATTGQLRTSAYTATTRAGGQARGKSSEDKPVRDKMRREGGADDGLRSRNRLSKRGRCGPRPARKSVCGGLRAVDSRGFPHPRIRRHRRPRDGG